MQPDQNYHPPILWCNICKRAFQLASCHSHVNREQSYKKPITPWLKSYISCNSFLQIFQWMLMLLMVGGWLLNCTAPWFSSNFFRILKEKISRNWLFALGTWLKLGSCFRIPEYAHACSSSSKCCDNGHDSVRIFSLSKMSNNVLIRI